MPSSYKWLLTCGAAVVLWGAIEPAHAQSDGSALLIVDETVPQVLNSFNVDIDLPDEALTGIITLGVTELLVPADLTGFLAQRGDGAFTGFAAQEQSRIEIEASSLTPQLEFVKEGAGDAAALVAGQQATIEHSGVIDLTLQNGIGDAFLAFTGDSSVVTINGNDRVFQFGNGSAIGARAAGSSTINLLGQLTVVDEGNLDAILALSSEQASILIAGTGVVEDLGNGQAIALAARDSSQIDFHGSYTLRQEGPGSAVLVDANGDSRVTVAGDLEATSSGPGFNFPPVILSEQAELEILSGRLASSGGLGSNQNELRLFDTASIHWVGGELDFGRFDPFFRLNDSSSLVIQGIEFDRPFGSVDDLSGSIQGTLSDGSPFTLDFERAANASIILVPEPSGLGCILLVIVARAFAERRS